MKKILQKDDPLLRAISEPISDSLFGSNELTSILLDMDAALDAEKDGVAIAAPQIGISKRIFMVRYDRLTLPPEGMALDKDIGVFINPEFVNASRRRETMDEGCLSVRGMYGKTARHERATVRAQDEKGRWYERGGGGILAQVYQHEIDHLDGILFIDHAIDIHEVEKEKLVATSIENED